MVALTHPIEASPASSTSASQAPARSGSWRAAMQRWLASERRVASRAPDDPDVYDDLNTQIWFLLPPC
jgi:hypothetical protein